MTTTKVRINLGGSGEATIEGVREVSVPKVTNMKFKVTDDMVDAAFSTAVAFEEEQAHKYKSQQDEQRGFIKAIIQAAADQWLQTKGGGYVSLGDYNSVCESYDLLHEEHGELVEEYGNLDIDYKLLQRKYKDLESDYYAVSDELVEIKDELYKRGIKL